MTRYPNTHPRVPHSAFSILHSPFRTLHSPFRTLHSLFCILLFLSACGPQPTLIPIPILPTETATPDFSPTPEATQTPYVITATPEASTPVSVPSGLFFLSMADGGRFHLFAYSPQFLSSTRLTSGDWDDITPALSADGVRLAFASNRNGYWDLYTLDLTSGLVVRLTDTPAFDAAPSWSPDGAWLAYESYDNGRLGIFVRSAADPNFVPIQLTDDRFGGMSPAWSPQGRQVAFVSNRSGEPEIWLTDLDLTGEERFTNVSQSPNGVEAHPAWSPDGSQLAWASTDSQSGLTSLVVRNVQTPSSLAHWAGAGDWPAWQDGSHLVTRLSAPNQTFLAGYTAAGGVSLPPVLLPAPLNALAFGSTPAGFPGAFQAEAQVTPAALYNLSPDLLEPGGIAGRASLVRLSGVQAPYPELHQLVGDSFQALRAQVAVKIGWDALGSLENAFVPLTTPLDPGLGEDWLYTGRAFTLSSSLMEADWMAIVREDFGEQTYWRIYLRTTAQDGSMGAPLRQFPWNFSARSGDPTAYENGGRLMSSIPAGYWFDLTALSIQYGWERLPALTNWRTYYAGARFNELASTQGLDWQSAMLQLYPPEVLVTPTLVIPATRTPTRTPPWYHTPTLTETPTPRPTYTP